MKKLVNFTSISLLFILLFGCFPNVTTSYKLEVPIWLHGIWEDPLDKDSYTFTSDGVIYKAISGTETDYKVIVTEAIANNPGARVEQYHTLDTYRFEVLVGTGTSQRKITSKTFQSILGTLNNYYHKK